MDMFQISKRLVAVSFASESERDEWMAIQHDFESKRRLIGNTVDPQSGDIKFERRERP